MRLFKKDGYNLVISDEAYALKAFRQIWNRDKSLSRRELLQSLDIVTLWRTPEVITSI